MLINQLKKYIDVNSTLRENINFIKCVIEQNFELKETYLTFETFFNQEDERFEVIVCFDQPHQNDTYQLKIVFYFPYEEELTKFIVCFNSNLVNDYFNAVKKTNAFNYIEDKNLKILDIDIFKMYI